MSDDPDRLIWINDAIANARDLAPSLEGIARAAREAARVTGSDRHLALATAEAALRLSLSLRHYADALQATERRSVAGLAIGYIDDDGRPMFIHHSPHWGNLLVTDRPEAAALWPSLEALIRWRAEANKPRGETTKGQPWPAPLTQHPDRELVVFPIKVEVGEPAAVIRRRIEREAGPR